MATNGVTAGETKNATHRFDPNFTQAVINATGPKASPRVRKLTASLIQHIHDFARENELTVDEWMAGLELVGAPIDNLKIYTKGSNSPR